VLLQFLILGKQTKDKCTDADDVVVNTDLGISETWKFMMDHWKLPAPKMIISVIDDLETISMNRRLMKSIIFNLVKTTTAEGIAYTLTSLIL